MNAYIWELKKRRKEKKKDAKDDVLNSNVSKRINVFFTK